MNTIREYIYLTALIHEIGQFHRLADGCGIGKQADMFSLPDAISKELSLIEQQAELEPIIEKAISLSLGIGANTKSIPTNSLSIQQDRMLSILETINRPSQFDGYTYRVPVCKMQLSEATFAKKEFASTPDYLKLWNEFINEYKTLQSSNIRSFSETLLQLLLKYTYCVPVNSIGTTDISLYDHIKTLASLAICLYDHEKQGEKGKSPFLLVGADFSGIQSYIYQIVSKFAGKNLKGRSFYLRMLSDAVVRYLLKSMNLFKANVIYNSGGGFYLLVPNTPQNKECLAKSIKHIEDEFFKAHGTSLFVAIDFIELPEDALMHRNGQELGKIWGDLFVKRDLKKSAKFASLIQSDYHSFFEPFMQGGEKARDSITGEEFKSYEKIITREDLKLKPLTNIQIEIGKKLRETNLIVIKEGNPLPCWEKEVHYTPANLGFTYYFLKDRDLIEQADVLELAEDKVTVITLNGDKGNCNFLQLFAAGHNIYNLGFYGGNETDTQYIPTFEDMCENENFSRMGVLRMDVDNLGNIFQKGIAPERATLSRFTALSRSFDYFFSGYLNTIWRETDPERSFIVYSGGDDVFIVGSWDICIELAEKIRAQFKAYTCFNPAFSLSGGVAIIGPKYPIMKGAEESEIEEKAAKTHYILDNKKRYEKDSISFMDMPLNWEHEYPAVKELKTRLVNLLKQGVINKSFISKVMSHYANAGIVNHVIRKVKTYWMLTYDLSRMKSRTVNEATGLIDSCICEVCDKSHGTLGGEKITTSYHPLELWAFACRWAELEYRTEE